MVHVESANETDDDKPVKCRDSGSTLLARYKYLPHHVPAAISTKPTSYY